MWVKFALCILLGFLLLSCSEESKIDEPNSSSVDQILPQIISTLPKDGAIDLDPKKIKTISVRFSEPIVTSEAKVFITPNVSFEVF